MNGMEFLIVSKAKLLNLAVPLTSILMELGKEGVVLNYQQLYCLTIPFVITVSLWNIKKPDTVCEEWHAILPLHWSDLHVLS